MLNWRTTQQLRTLLGLILCLALLTQSTYFALRPAPPAPGRDTTPPPAASLTPPAPPQSRPGSASFPQPPSPPGAQLSRLSNKAGFPTANKQHPTLNGSLPLAAGWNLLSLPQEPANSDPAAVLAALAGSLSRVYAYDGCDSADPWKLYDPADLPASDLTNLDHTLGFWLESSAPVTLAISGTAHLSTTIPLCTGWNLVGYPLARPQTVATALASIQGQYSRVFAYDAPQLTDPWAVFSPAAETWGNDLEVMLPGRGYWIYATTNTNLTFSEPPGPDISLPRVTVIAQPEIVDPGQTVYLAVAALDDTTILSRTLTVNGVPQPLDPYGQASYVPVVAGIYTATGTATDLDGNTGHDTAYFRARAAVDNGPPQVALLAPAGDSIISATTNLTGTATDSDLAYYELQARPGDTGDYSTFLRRFSPVLTGTLGALNPQAFPPGLYDVRVCAEDTWGNQSCSAPLRYELNSRNVLPGIMHFAFQDGLVNAAGFPIAVQRIYDSRDKTTGDFGVGWHLSLGETRLNANRVLGNDWQQVQQGSVYAIAATADHRLTVRLPDGTFHRFRMRPNPESQPFVPITNLNGAVFQPLGSTNSQLTASPPPAFFDSLTGTILDSGGGIYSPNSYTLALIDGTKLTFTRNGSVAALTYRLTQIEDPNGNTLAITPAGFTHSSGVSISLTRDPQGRITSLTDANGSSRTYTYDANGDLVATTDFDGYLTQYIYDTHHNLVQFIDPRGQIPGTIIYDDSGRMVATIDANGHRINIQHDDDAGQEIITDPLGNPTIISYDRRGNVISVVDAAGGQTSYHHDNRDNLLARTDARGNTERWRYDNDNRVISYTNALTQTTLMTYNALGKIATETDALGHTITYNYDLSGNLTAVTNPLGETTTFEYDAQGNQTAIVDPLGNRTELAYDSQGNVLQVTDPAGRITRATYNNNGLLLTQQITVTTPAGPQSVTIAQSYDNSGRLRQRTDPAGNSLDITYNPIGRPASVTDRGGSTLTTSYNSAGQVSQTTLPNGATHQQQYDSRGLLTRQVDDSGQLTTIAYDPLGRQTTATAPDGHSTGRGYDPTGNLTSYTDERGHIITLSYDPLGRPTTILNNGQVTQYAYDAAGNLVAETNANGQTTQYEYDAANRPTRVILPNGASHQIRYDSAGRKTAEIDPLGHITRFGYDPAGQLISVTNPLSQTTRYTYNEMGQLITITDPLSRTTSFQYDLLGQMTRRTLPSGSFERFTYDSRGNLASHTDFNGQTTTYTYDEMNNLASRTRPGGILETYTYTPAGQLATITGPDGTTSFTYDNRHRLTSVSYPSGHSLSYTYDAAGNLAGRIAPSGSISYTYDAQDRLATVLDPDGGLATYTYDNEGNLTGIRYPNGITTTISYNSLNQPLRLRTAQSSGTLIAAYDYVYNPAGLRTQVTELDGSTTTYTYDPLNRLTREHKTSPTNTTLHDQRYTYDPAGNRHTQTTFTGTLTNTITYTYGLNDQLLAAGTTTYTYDANGNQLTRTTPGGTTTYTYDSRNLLLSAATPTALIEYGYDPLGLRTFQRSAGTETRYLYDINAPVPQLLEERNSSDALLNSYVLGHGHLSTSQAGSRAYYHFDAHRSTRQLSNNSQTITDSYTYDAFGRLLSHSGSSSNPLLYAGEQYDSAAGLYFLRARYYNPNQGRFTGRDPFFGLPTNSQTLNPYLYALNNPVQLTDPTGHFSAAEAIVAASIANTLNAMQTIVGATYIIGATVFSNPTLLKPPAHAGRVALSFAGGASFFGLGSLGANAGVEMLYFTGEADQPNPGPHFYYYLGGSVGATIGAPSPEPIAFDASVTLELGHVFNCSGSPGCYTGSSFPISGSMGAGGFAAGLSVFSGSPAFDRATLDKSWGANGYGWAFTLASSADPKGEITLRDLSLSVGFGITYYYSWPDVPSAIVERSLDSMVPSLARLAGGYQAELLAARGPLRDHAQQMARGLFSLVSD
ncbi:MAG: hypothetical protein H6666_16245 [Ardenticatenaceae bacterium]|nr:hypothetical protein [Ardenticatenaceae bacterium]